MHIVCYYFFSLIPWLFSLFLLNYLLLFFLIEDHYILEKLTFAYYIYCKYLVTSTTHITFILAKLSLIFLL